MKDLCDAEPILQDILYLLKGSEKVDKYFGGGYHKPPNSNQPLEKNFNHKTFLHFLFKTNYWKLGADFSLPPAQGTLEGSSGVAASQETKKIKS